MERRKAVKYSILFLLFVLIPCGASAEAPALRYRSTGSNPLVYRTVYHWRQVDRVLRSKIRYDSDQIAEDESTTTSYRRLALTKKVQREKSMDEDPTFLTRIASVIQRQESSRDMKPLASQRIAVFKENSKGFTRDPFSVEALAHLGLPLIVDDAGIAGGQSWQALWKLRLEDGQDQVVTARYEIVKQIVLAGLDCVLIRYSLQAEDVSNPRGRGSDPSLDTPLTAGSAGLSGTPPSSPASREAGEGEDDKAVEGQALEAEGETSSRFSGSGTFAFDTADGQVVFHSATLDRSLSSSSFEAQGRQTRQRDIQIEIAEVLVP